MYSFAENIFIILALKILSIYFNMGLVLILASDNFLINHIVTLCALSVIICQIFCLIFFSSHIWIFIFTDSYFIETWSLIFLTCSSNVA